ncbi:hypothetical protein EMPS_07639 [Entomortierella parvispora]|uniref:Uncharacterized protein n=1 Tax=Entomortierella parvispora TaxID=205924 RepID=A0A9P3LYC1_9FUNG|nr:hypothetical protein EMPS_07639 [Entomortierella parvispora]
MEETKHEYPADKLGYVDEKNIVDNVDLAEDADNENSRIEAVRLVVPITDDPTLAAITFRFWTISFIFSVIGAVIQQYYFFRSTSGTFSIYFVNLVSYGMGKAMARTLPMRSISIGSFSMSFNPGPFNLKEHALISIAVNTAANAAYAIDILSAMDLELNHRIGTLGALLLLLTTQCVGYGMAGVLRKYLVYPAEMVWWPNLVQVVFFNAIHNTDEFKSKKMVRGWSYMKFFWVVSGVLFLWEFFPQFIAPIFGYIDWICWIKPFDYNFWAIFSSISGGGVFSISLDWTSIGGSTLYFPLYAMLCNFGGNILSYWILLPALWMTNTLGTKAIGHPLTSKLFHVDTSAPFNITPYLNPDYSLNEEKFEAEAGAVKMSPMYAINFFLSFVALAGCVSQIICFQGPQIWKAWKSAISGDEEDIHTKMMRVYPEVPQWWYGLFYLIMVALAIVTCECYGLELPWWALLISLAIGWVMTLPIGAMQAITGFQPGLNVITELICGYMLPGKPIANMVFKCYGYMSMYQCTTLLSDLKLGHYMKIPPRSLFIAQFYGTVIGAIINYYTMILIINAHRSWLNGVGQGDPSGLWTGYNVQTYWGSALIYGALGPQRMFSNAGGYGFIFYGFLVGAIIPIILWALSKKFPKVSWEKFNIAIIAGGMSAYPNGYSMGILGGTVTAILFQFYLFRYHKAWWQKYTFILSAALDTGAAFTGLFIFCFLGGGLSPKLAVSMPSWWGNHITAEGNNAPYLAVDRCGAAINPDGSQNWTSGTTL